MLRVPALVRVDVGYDACCSGTDDGQVAECWYELEDGTRYACDGVDCAQAAEEMICDTCPDICGS